MRITSFGPLLIIVAALLWALDGVLRRSLFDLPPIAIVFYEHLIGAVIIAPFFLATFKKEKLTRYEWGAIFWVSLLSGLLGTLWFTTALAKVNFIAFSVVFLLQKLQPLFAIATARILLREKITKHYLVWAAVALIAAYFVTFPNGVVNLTTGGGTIIAALFALGAAFAWGTSTAFSRYALLNHSGTVITGLRFFITVLLAFIGMLLLRGGDPLVVPTINQTGRLAVIALSTGLVALWIYYQGLKHTQTKIATILELVFPLVAVLIDIFVFKTVLAPSQYGAAVILIFAIYRVSLLNKKIPLTYTAAVLPGRKKGRAIGFPTLNLNIPQEFTYRHGIYAGHVHIRDHQYRAAIHFGPVPVFNQEAPTLEAFLLDVTLLETPKQISFRLVDFIREVRTFANENDLAQQIARDVELTREILDGTK